MNNVLIETGESMKGEIVESNWFKADTNEGTVFFPCDYFSKVDIMTEHSEITKFSEIEKVKGFGARLSMLGYMDSTDWTVFDSYLQARRFLRDFWEVAPVQKGVGA